MTKFRYIACNAMTRAQIDPSLRLSNPEWTQNVNGNGTMKARIVVPQNSDQIARLKLATAPHQAAWYVRKDDDTYDYGGVVIEREWDPKTRLLSVSTVDWRAWFFWVFLSPRIDMAGDIAYGWNSVDQIQIARELATTALQNGGSDGRPPILVDTTSTTLSGVGRDLNGTGLNFKTLGDLLTTMSNRERGFEWGVEVRTDTLDGLPRVWFVPYFPQRGSVIPGLRFRATPSSTNLAGYGPIKESAADRIQRVWTTGAGQPPDQVFAQDTNPNIASGLELLTEKVTNYSTVTNRSTLASHARAERDFFYPLTTLVSVQATLDRPMPYNTYQCGDRGELRIQDDWVDWSLNNVRIISRTTTPQDLSVKLSLDLSDTRLPEVDAGGSV